VSLGSHLRQLRLARGLSIRALAERAKVNPSTLSRWESDSTSPRVYELEAVLNALQANGLERAQALEQLHAPRGVRALAAASVRLTLPAGAAPIGGELLKAMRRRRGWTLEQVACHIGVTVSTVSRWERSESWPAAEQLARLCAVLGASEAEQAALQGGRGVLHWLPFPVASASDLAALLDALHNDQLPIDPALTELTYLCLQGRIWQLVGRGTRRLDCCSTPMPTTAVGWWSKRGFRRRNSLRAARCACSGKRVPCARTGSVCCTRWRRARRSWAVAPRLWKGSRCCVAGYLKRSDTRPSTKHGFCATSPST
jgi:transcriptional regulator with XRE-family HTH domain